MWWALLLSLLMALVEWLARLFLENIHPTDYERKQLGKVLNLTNKAKMYCDKMGVEAAPDTDVANMKQAGKRWWWPF